MFTLHTSVHHFSATMIHSSTDTNVWLNIPNHITEKKKKNWIFSINKPRVQSLSLVEIYWIAGTD